MPGARRGRPDDRSIAGRKLWTLDGTNALIRKLQSDPGLTEEFRKEAIEAVRSGAAGRGVAPPEPEEPPEPELEVEMTEPKAAPELPTPDPMAGESFDAYQTFSSSVALYPPDVGIPYTATGICGEAAEVAGKVQAILAKNLMLSEGLTGDDAIKNLHALNDLLRLVAKLGEDAEKFKKAVRKGEKKLPALKPISEGEQQEIAKEIGDVLWYCAQLAKSIGLPLSTIAKMNVDKLSSRKARNVLHGSGDNR